MDGREGARAWLLCALCACAALAVGSTSSPLYATNFWTDTNIYFTIGRGMTRGLAPYRDLFDHKGPLLYLLYALGACVDGSGFLGVFLLEAASLTAALYIGWRTACLWGEGRAALLAIPVLAGVTVCCRAFTQGGSAEEFCLPALALGLYASLRVLLGRTARGGFLHAAVGAAAGWVFLIKFTDCGLFIGLGLCLMLDALCTDGVRRAAACALAMAGGLAAMCAPVLGVMAAMGALSDCVDVYIAQNLFDYGGPAMGLTEHIYNALAYLRTQSAANPAVAALAALGCAWGFACGIRQRRAALALCVPVSAGLLLLFCYWGEMAHPYYALVFAALCPVGLAPLGALAGRLGRRAQAALTGVCCAALIPACMAMCAAVPLMDVAREDMPQTVFAEIMAGEDEATLLDITSLDQGFYLAAGITPSCRYFADNNLNTREKREAIDGYLAQGRTLFVVTRYADPGEHYERIAEATGVFDLNDVRTYTLYRRRDGAREEEDIGG